MHAVDAGRVTKGVRFLDNVDVGDPLELARFYDREGADELVFYDITASSDERSTMYDVVRRTAEQVFIPLTVGGGVRTPDDVNALLRAGADKVSLNSAAVAHPRLLFLGDILPVPHAIPFANVYSIGDVCIAVGVAIAIHGLTGSRFVPRRFRAAAEAPAPESDAALAAS